MIITSSVAGTSLAGSSMPYSVTKAAQLHLMRGLALTQGEKVRVNAVLPGLLLTEWVSVLFLSAFSPPATLSSAPTAGIWNSRLNDGVPVGVIGNEVSSGNNCRYQRAICVEEGDGFG
jgi:NAD(P)-dependent dehydrogenase (short-subunit alcohol dehydrogenase family)